MKRTVCAVAVAMIAALVPVGSAVAAPSIQFLNPTPLRTGQVPEVSNKGGVPLHLVAWAQEAPPGALVEFEVTATATTPPSFNSATVDGSSRGAGTYDAFFVFPNDFSDGQYTLRVGIFTSDGSEEVASDTQIVTLNNKEVPPPAAAENVEITFPENADQLGFFNPKDRRTNTLVSALASSMAEQIRVLYTKSAVGTEPTWIPCGSGPTDAAGFATVRCTLAEGDAGSAVTGIAAAANLTPFPAPPDPSQDEGTDAHRVVPYVAQPASVVITPESDRAEVGRCKLLTVNVFDQFSRPLAAANVDVHANGPDDQLTFGRDPSTPVTNRTSAFKAPDQGHVSDKRTVDCSDNTQDEEQRQGLHRSIGTADRVHIESAATASGGTSDAGTFVFALLSRTVGGTQISAWADVNDDDAQNLDEASGGAVLGWGQDPPPPRKEIFLDPDGASATVGSCQSLTLVAREGGNALGGANIDVHIQGPDASVQFCIPPGSTQALREPDSGDHVAGVHPGGQPKHGEGETDPSGRFVFGVMSATEGRTEVLAWIDENDDDSLQPGEPSSPGHVTFQPQGARSISLNANKRRASSGSRVRFSGDIDGSANCSAGQPVRLKSRKPGGRRFVTIASRSSSEDGSFSFRVRVRKTRDYRAVSPRNGVCDPAKSRIVRVRAT
jgi:hypothetical protein